MISGWTPRSTATVRRGWRLAGVLAVVLALGACGGDDGDDDGSGAAGNAAPSEGAHQVEGPVDTSNLDDAVQVRPELDDAAAVTATFGLDGGEMSVEAADGSVFTLTIPADSLRYSSTITMTPVSAIEGLPFGDDTAFMVDLQPSGLAFDRPAVLSIDPASPIPVDEQVPITYQGTELTIARPVVDAADIQVEIDHFSGYGVAKGLLGDVEEARRRLGGSAESRIESELNALLMEDRQRQLAGDDPDPDLWERVRGYFEQYEREVLDPRVAAAGNSCAEGRLAVDTYLGFHRTMQLLGFHDDDSAADAQQIMDAMAGVCIEEEYQMCVEQHIVHRLAPLYLEIARMSDLFDGVGAEVVAQAEKRVGDCLRFELEVTVNAVTEQTWDAQWFQLEETISDTTELTVDVVFDTEALRFQRTSVPIESPAPSGVVVGTDCRFGPLEPWSSSADFVDMGWSVDEHDMREALGRITDLSVELDLPEVTILLSEAWCGVSALDVEQHGVSAPSVFRTHFPDQAIRGWTILGGETIATAEWESVLPPPSGDGTSTATGTARLVHRPR